MFLSDELISIGRQANQKNNQSMHDAVHKMNDTCRQSIKNGEMPLRAKNAFCLAVNTLNKEGYLFYTHEHYNAPE